MSRVQLDVDPTDPPPGVPAHIHLEVDGFRYFVTGDRVVTLDGRAGVVTSMVPVRLDDGTHVCLALEECRHADEVEGEASGLAGG